MLNISPQELLLILVIALVIVGPRRLPELGRSIGKGVRELRKAQDEVRKTIQVSLDDDKGRPTFGDRSEAAAGRAATAGTAPADTDVAPGSSATDDTREISKTLGRGLAELRRARAEIERSFRVEIDAPPKRRAAKPRRRSSAADDGATDLAGTAPHIPDDAAAGERSAPE